MLKMSFSVGFWVWWEKKLLYFLNLMWESSMNLLVNADYFPTCIRENWFAASEVTAPQLEDCGWVSSVSFLISHSETSIKCVADILVIMLIVRLMVLTACVENVTEKDSKFKKIYFWKRLSERFGK